MQRLLFAGREVPARITWSEVEAALHCLGLEPTDLFEVC
jgi:hypothetical protein